MDEFSFIEYLRKKTARTARVPIGIGDDAAVLDVAEGKQLVVATDAIVDGVDFHIKKLSPERIGRKALAINLSDLAAMGARPTAFVITIGKPVSVPPAWLFRFYGGLLRLAREYRVHCAGGDISRSEKFFANVTIFGEVAKGKAVTRSGALKGDWIAVSGNLGGSLLRHHHAFTPRLLEADFLARKKFATAMIDVSDGLVQDLRHILKASKTGARLELDSVPVSWDARKMAGGKRDKALARALSDGEDFELLFTVRPGRKRELERVWPRRFPRVPLSWIGRVEGKTPRIFWERNGKAVPEPVAAGKGFAHF